MTPDVNLLVAVDRGEHPHHEVASAWADAALTRATRAEPYTLLPMVVVGYVRVVTSPRFPAGPTPLARALGNMTRLLRLPHVRLAALGTEWADFAEVCARHGLAGPIISDAWIAASVLDLNEHLVTFDRGFRRLLPPRHLTVLRPEPAA